MVTAGRISSTRSRSLVAPRRLWRAVCAARLLHDVVEDPGLTVSDVIESLGSQIQALVAALTEDTTIEAREAQASLREGVAGPA